MNELPLDVPDYTALSELRYFMCGSEEWRSHARYIIALEVDELFQRNQHLESLFWMMSAHAKMWELKGWSFEPDHTEILTWVQ